MKMDIDRFRRLPLLGILRGITAADVPPLAEAVAAAGLEAIEITMNTTSPRFLPSPGTSLQMMPTGPTSCSELGPLWNGAVPRYMRGV